MVPLTSTRFLDCVAEVAVAHLLLEQALIAEDRLRNPDLSAADRAFYEGKRYTAAYYANNFLPQVFGRARIIKLRNDSAVRIPEDSL
jgi:hypothetical protein